MNPSYADVTRRKVWDITQSLTITMTIKTDETTTKTIKKNSRAASSDRSPTDLKIKSRYSKTITTAKIIMNITTKTAGRQARLVPRHRSSKTIKTSKIKITRKKQQ